MLELLFVALLVFLLVGSIIGFMQLKVKKVSRLYNETAEIIKSTTFYQLEPIIEIVATLNSKKEFDTYNYDSLFQEAIIHDMFNTKLDLAIEQSELNKKNWLEYRKKLSELDLSQSKTDNKKTHIPYFIYKKIETKLIKEIVHNKPVIYPVIRMVKTYTSPAGRNTYEHSRDYKLTDVPKHRKLLQIKEKRERAHKKSAAYQRSIMTPSLRYDILRRDKFRCQICGHSQEDGVKLHVDHIIPIAKGGKTSVNNLRTLCADCNLGKSHKYDSQGIN